MRPTSLGPKSFTCPGDWPARHREWQRRLPRLRLGAEPVPEQVERLRRATMALSAVVGGIGLMFVALFSAFGAPLLGLAIGGLLSGAIIGPAWRSFLRTRTLAGHYLQEYRAAMGEASCGVPSGGRPSRD